MSDGVIREQLWMNSLKNLGWNVPMGIKSSEGLVALALAEAEEEVCFLPEAPGPVTVPALGAVDKWVRPVCVCVCVVVVVVGG